MFQTLLCLNASPDAADTIVALKVGIYNIHGGVGVDGRKDLPRIARVLQTAAPEIVGLNEVERYISDDNQDAQIAKELGPDWTSVFGKTTNKPLCDYGNAILTRLPIISSESWLFTAYQNQERRGMVRVTVRKHGQPIHVFCTHMGLRDEMRSRHAAEILLIMSRFTDAQRILLGDFNEGRGSRGVESIAEEFNDIWSKYGIGQEKTYSSIAPVRRIDFIWADKELAATSCYVAKFPETNTASDHLPVFANLLKPSDLQLRVQEITVQLNGKEIQSATQIATASHPCEVDLDTVLHAITSPFACEEEYENSLVKILHPVYNQNLAGTLPGQMPTGWTQSHRSAGVTPFGGVILIGTCKLWRQRSEQQLSFHHVLPTSPSLSEFEVSARLKTMATGGGAWQLEAVTTSSRPPHNSYSIEISHNARHLPRLRLMTGEQELETLNLSDFQIDPYDWNHYALALTRRSMENGETTTCLTVYVNGRRIVKALDVEAGRNAKDYSTTASIVLTTTGRHDAACEVYAENIMIRQWKTAQEPDPTSETGSRIFIRSFPPNTSIIESQFQPSSRWRGFF